MHNYNIFFRKITIVVEKIENIVENALFIMFVNGERQRCESGSECYRIIRNHEQEKEQIRNDSKLKMKSTWYSALATPTDNLESLYREKFVVNGHERVQ